MQFTITVNQSKALEWGLNAQQAMLFAFVYECPSWCRPVKTETGIFYALSKAKIIEELPVLTDKPDTAYRLLKQLESTGVIDLSHTSSITLVRLTDKGREWNKKADGSEKYPSKVGKISEQGRKNIRARSEKYPTNQDTSNHGTNQVTNHEGEKAPRAKREKFDPVQAKPENVTMSVWLDWCRFRREIRKPLTETTCRQQAKLLENLVNADAVILKSVANGWTGLFPGKSAPRNKPSLITQDFTAKTYESTPNDQLADFLQ